VTIARAPSPTRLLAALSLATTLACGTSAPPAFGQPADSGTDATLPPPDAASFPDGCAPAPSAGGGYCQPSGSSSGGYPGYPVLCTDSVTLSGSFGCVELNSGTHLSGTAVYCCP
jgi:hypothetical protein